jgi:signal transduction histidine kinase/ActR/RegA family two-component response regulator
MSEKIEPTMTISRPGDFDTYRTMVEKQIEKLNTILRNVLNDNEATAEIPVGPEAEIFAESFHLLQKISTFASQQRPVSGMQSPIEEGISEKELASAALRCISDTVFILDPSGRIVYFNDAAAELEDKVKAPDFAGKKLSEVLTLMNEGTMEPCDKFCDIIEEGGSKEYCCLLVREKVGERKVMVRGECLKSSADALLGILIIIRDITQQEQMEEELLKVRKLESIGLLAGGIAHDFNNILTGIITNLFMARMSVYQNEEACQLIADAEKAAFKATRLTKQLLTFSQGGAPVKEHIVVSQLVEETVGFSLSGSNVDYRLHFSDDLWTVEVDKGQIDQVLNNLVINAAQAMAEGGTITISAENYILENETNADTTLKGKDLPLTDGNYVRIMVRDEGPGIPRKHIGKIFDPYFTTKQGNTGLGLTTAYSIIKKHAGHIEVESQFGNGAIFYCYLPAVMPEKDEENTDGVISEGEECGKVLVMDDDIIIRTVVEKLLKKTGYNVQSVTNGTDALRVYQDAYEADDPFQFVIMDLTIPGGMGGKETVVKLREFDNDATVIVFSGYSNDPILTNYSEYGFDGVLKKPFSTDELMHLIKNVGIHHKNGQ